MTATSTATKRTTVEELWELRDEPYRLALIDGELFRMPGAGALHGRTRVKVVGQLDPFVERRGLGSMFADTGFRLYPDRDTALFPDIAFVRTARLPTEEEEVGFLRAIPDLAIEIVSPTDYLKVREAKITEYLAAGTPEVWQLFPRTKEMLIYGRWREPVRLGPDDHLDGGDVLPGFRIRVADLFGPPPPRR